MENKIFTKKIALCIMITALYCNIIVSQNLLVGVNSAGSAEGGGSMFTIKTDGSGYTSVCNYTVDVPGQNPANVKLCTAPNGKMYGTTVTGGIYNFGVLFAYDPVVNTYTVVHNFNTPGGTGPRSGLILATDGLLYGVTYLGGTNSQGTMYKFDPATNVFTKIYDFGSTQGVNPYGRLMQASNNLIYGMTRAGGTNSVGVIFSYDISTSTYSKLYDMLALTGSYPMGSLTEYSGSLYGLTSAGGTNSVGVIFQYNYSASIYAKRHDLISASEGANPYSTMVLAPNNKFYGMCAGGGTNTKGTIFEYVSSTNIFTNKYNLSATSGSNPYGELEMTTSGKYYGLNAAGGTNSVGTVFSYDYATNTYSNVFDMSNANGAGPSGSLTQHANGKLYGISGSGGNSPLAYTVGDLFEFNPTGNVFTQKKIFEYSSNGKYPRISTLVKATDGYYYGTTEFGGINNYGAMYRFDITTGIYTKLRDFSWSSGAYPTGPLIQATDGNIYGTTYKGGSNSQGVFFRYNITTNTYSMLYGLFVGGSANPYSGVMQASNGKLYGMGYQHLWSWDIPTSTYNSVTTATNTSYCTPVEGNNATLYGVKTTGGTSGFGYIWRYNTTTNTFSTVYNFTNTATGYYPYGSLAIGSNGNLFGLLKNGGANGFGSFFEYDYVNNLFYDRHDFTGSDGRLPEYNTPFLASDGNIYCTVKFGGVNNAGSIFKWDYTNFTQLYDFSQATGHYPTGSLLEITCAPLSPPAAITGNANLCSNAVTIYSATPVVGATSYSWTLPGGWGGTSTTNTISVLSGVLSGNVSCSAKSACGTSTPKTYSVTITQVPATPGTVTGLNAMCIGSPATNYSVATVSGASSYSWSLPGGWSGTSSTNSITATPGASGGNITVASSNSCGISSASVYSITINALPTVSISGSNTVCIGSNVILSGTGATSYSWSTGSTAVNINVSPTVTTTYSVTGTDANGCKNTSALTVTATICTGIQILAVTGSEFMVYPNPFGDKLIITTDGIKQQLKVYNVLGSLVYESIIETEKTEIDLNNQSSGIYFIRIGSVIKKIIKN